MPVPIWFLRRALYSLQRNRGLSVQIDAIESMFLRKKGIQVLFGISDRGPHFKLPLALWIPDFQHRHFPEMFSQQEIERRDRNLRQAARHARAIILSSQSAFKDLEAFAPEAVHKTSVLKFVAQLPDNALSFEPKVVSNHYNLPEKFFYLPNQFWKHKNHELVVKALAIAKQSCPEIVIVCSGNTNDYRDPGYFPRLQQLISDSTVQENMIVLGMITQEHIIPLMRQALALVQPSLFEGWSTTVKKAKSIGQRIIISDIPVHKEQNPPAAMYFDPHDPQALAACLIKIYREVEPGPDTILEAQAQIALPNRTHAFGTKFVEIVEKVVN